jgi:D-aspartate ligase
MKNNNIIIFGGSITCWGVLQGLKKNNLNIYVVSNNMSSIGSSSKYVSKHYSLRSNETGYINKVKQIIDDVGGRPILLIAGDDHALEELSRNYTEIKSISIPTFPPWERLSCVVDKASLAKAAEEIGLKTIPTIAIKNETELQSWLKRDLIPYENGYFLKCQDSISFKNKYGTKGVICKTKQEILDSYRTYNGFLGGLLLQKYMVGEIDELLAVLMVLDKDSNVVEYNIQKKLRAGGGQFGSTSLSITQSNEKLLNEAQKLVKHLKCVGPVGVQFKFDDDDEEYKLMEINSRFSVGVSLAVGAGDNLPLGLILNINGKSFPRNHKKIIGFYLWNPLTDLTFIFSKKIFNDFRNNLKILYMPKIVAPLDYSDIKPFKMQFLAIFKAILKRLNR